jgi:hypothetical protein
MNNKLHLILICSIAVLLTNPVYGQEELNKFERWVGNWSVKMEGNTIHESWIRNVDGSYSGESWTKKSNGDSVHTESIRIHMLNDNIYYEPIVKDQHGREPTPFRLIISSSSEWMFSNPDNDFPKYILYKWIDENHLRASIGNSNSDSDHTIIFNYEKY